MLTKRHYVDAIATALPRYSIKDQYKASVLYHPLKSRAQQRHRSAFHRGLLCDGAIGKSAE